jgi:ubiquinone/menaquinone biosynthesis C-methylase UbiE
MGRVDYDRMAGDYAEGRELPAAGLQPWRGAIRPWVPPGEAGSPALDLGAGTGQFAAAIAGWFGVRVLAVEPSAGMRAQAARLHSHPGVTLVGGRGERLPLRDGCCGWAWASTVVHHLDDLPATARELRRVLRPGAPVLVRQAFPDRLDAVTLYRRFFLGAARIAADLLPTVEHVAEGFAAAGFRPAARTSVIQQSAPSLAAYLHKVRRRADTGLRLLPDAAFAAGLAALEQAAAAEATPTPVTDRLDLLVLR